MWSGVWCTQCYEQQSTDKSYGGGQRHTGDQDDQEQRADGQEYRPPMSPHRLDDVQQPLIASLPPKGDTIPTVSMRDTTLPERTSVESNIYSSAASWTESSGMSGYGGGSWSGVSAVGP